jgi:hypothetical protein
MIALRRLADLLDAYRPQRRNAKHDAERLGGPGDRPFTVMMEQPLKCSRCAEQGHLYFLAHDGYRHVNAFDTRENVGRQITPLVGFGISPIRDSSSAAPSMYWKMGPAVSTVLSSGNPRCCFIDRHALAPPP